MTAAEPVKHRLGVILKVDGTLVNAHEGRAQAWVEALADHGHHVQFRDIRPLLGMVPHELLSLTIGLGLDTPEGVAVRDRARSIFEKRYLPRLATFYRAPALVRQMVASGIRIVVASIDPQSSLELFLEKLEAGPLIHRAVYPQPTDRVGAKADIIRLAAEKTRSAARASLVLTDCPEDIEIAKKLGLASVALRSGGWSRAQLAGATVVYDDACHLLAEFGASPLAS